MSTSDEECRIIFNIKYLTPNVNVHLFFWFLTLTIQVQQECMQLFFAKTPKGLMWCFRV